MTAPFKPLLVPTQPGSLCVSGSKLLQFSPWTMPPLYIPCHSLFLKNLAAPFFINW